MDKFELAVKRATGWMPYRLRHTGAYLIHRLGLDRETTDLILGHYPGGVSLTYNPINWGPLVKAVERYSASLRKQKLA